MKFTGKFTFKLDDRNRVPIPVAYRDAFAVGAQITTGGDSPCLVLHTPESLDEAAALIEAIPPDTYLGEQVRRDFYANMQPFKKDAQGRITLTPDLMAYAGIEKEVMFVGTGRRLEIWDKDRFLADEAARRQARQEAMNARQNGTLKEE